MKKKRAFFSGEERERAVFAAVEVVVERLRKVKLKKFCFVFEGIVWLLYVFFSFASLIAFFCLILFCYFICCRSRRSCIIFLWVFICLTH